jgi:hypothetical protein
MDTQTNTNGEFKHAYLKDFEQLIDLEKLRKQCVSQKNNSNSKLEKFQGTAAVFM